MFKRMKNISMIMFAAFLCYSPCSYASAADNETVKSLVDKYHQASDDSNRKNAAIRLSKIEPKKQQDVELLISIADTEKDAIQDASIASLKRVKDAAFADLFYKHIKNGEPRTRNISIVKMGEFKYKAAVPDLVNMVKSYDKLTKHVQPTESALQIQAAFTLGEIGDERALPVLLSKLGEMDFMEAQVIAKFGKKAFPQLVDIAKTTKDEKVKIEANNAIGMIRDKELVPELWHMIQVDPAHSDPYIIALLNMVDQTTTPTENEVEDFLFKSAANYPELKSHAVLIAKNNNNSDYLISILKDKRNGHGLRTSAIIYLGDLKAQSAVPLLLETLKEHDRDIRILSAQALEKITSKKVE